MSRDNEPEIICICPQTDVSCPHLSGAGPIHSKACVVQTHTWAGKQCLAGVPQGHIMSVGMHSPSDCGLHLLWDPKHQLLKQDPLLGRQSKPGALGP